MLFFIADTNLFLSFQGLRIIRFSLAGFNFSLVNSFKRLFFFTGVNRFVSWDYCVFVAFMDLVRWARYPRLFSNSVSQNICSIFFAFNLHKSFKVICSICSTMFTFWSCYVTILWQEYFEKTRWYPWNTLKKPILLRKSFQRLSAIAAFWTCMVHFFKP